MQSMAPRRSEMTQKVIDVVGVSTESFAKAAENAVAEAARTVRNLKWARVSELEMELDGKKITQYRSTTKIYFDIEH
jgi:flavin-binding protein dodecin